jgi:hypothetical protein
MTNNNINPTIDYSAIMLPPKRGGLAISDNGALSLSTGATANQRKRALILGTDRETQGVQSALTATLAGLGGQVDSAFLSKVSAAVLAEGWEKAPLVLGDDGFPAICNVELTDRKAAAVARAEKRAEDRGEYLDAVAKLKAEYRAENSAYRALAECRSAIDRKRTSALALMVAHQAAAVRADVEAERKVARDNREAIPKARKAELKALAAKADAATEQAQAAQAE